MKHLFYLLCIALSVLFMCFYVSFFLFRYQNELPKRIKSRGKDAHLIHEELVQTMKWKQTVSTMATIWIFPVLYLNNFLMKWLCVCCARINFLTTTALHASYALIIILILFIFKYLPASSCCYDTFGTV